MTDVAVTEHKTDQAPAPAGRPPRIPRRVRNACALIADGSVKTITAAADRVGMNRSHLSRMLSKPHVRVYLARKASENIASATLRASSRLVELIDAQSEHVAAKVSERILTSEGILKADQQSVAVSVDVRAGFVIDLSEPSHTAHIRDFEAKPLIDQGTRQSSGGERDE